VQQLAVPVLGSMMQHVERELQYRCSSGNGRGSGSVMGNNTGSSNAMDVRKQAKHQHRY